MTTIGEVAHSRPIEVSTTSRVDDAARFMSEFGIGDLLVTDPETGVVVGILTDRDIVVRLVARDLDAPSTAVGDICTQPVITIAPTADVARADELMRQESIRRLALVDEGGRPVGIVSIEDLAASGCVADEDLSQVMASVAAAYRANRILGEPQ